MNALTTCVLLFSHWVGDYLLQFNSIANKKSHSLGWLGLHIVIYGVVLFAAAGYLFPFQKALHYTVLNTGLHGITDLVTSRLANRYRSNPRIFYPIVGFDQFLHAATLLVTI